MCVRGKPSKSAPRYRDSPVRPELDDLVMGLAGCDQLVHLERIPAKPARTASLARPVPTALADLVPEGGLWTHQAAAIDPTMNGHEKADAMPRVSAISSPVKI